ncbi:MAG: 4Fe-4S binding protein, partial [Candidatus Omnitrophica bacterium]|nr:4Fe-4S binding protein [Candidatus Omnitrophota bacterium]
SGLYNTDRQPLTFFLNTLVLARYSGLPLAPLVTRAFFSGFIIFCMPLCIFFIARLVFLMRIENHSVRRLSLHATIFQFFSGFLGFSFHLCLIFMFQNRFGTIFVFIGALSALFMLGLAVGGFAGRILAFRFSPPLAAAAVLGFQGALILSGCAFFVFVHMPAALAGGLFIVLFFIGGFFTGNSYPLVAAIFKHTRADDSSSAATLIVLDHWGGALAGAITGLLLLPLAGLTHTLVILALVAFFAAGLCALESKCLSALLKKRSISFLSFPYIRFSCVLIATALSLLCLRYFLERPVPAPGLPVTIPAAGAGCIMQEEPFRALVCPTATGREYHIDSNDFGRGVKGFAGPLRLALCLSEQGEIKEVKVIEHRETALYVREFEKFLAQFSGRRVTESFSRDTIDVMSGATITSGAVIDFVKEMVRLVHDPLDPGSQFQKTSPVIFDGSFWYACIMLGGALVLYCFPVYTRLRTAFLFIVVILSGFIFNHTFSLTHLAHIFVLRPIPLTVASVAFVFLVPVTLGIFFGQLWCGWLCPFGALQELVGFRARKLPARIDKKARYGKYLVLFGVILAVVFSSSEFWFAHEPLSVFFSRVPVRFKLLGLIALFFSLFFRRFWCRYFCAAGAFLSFFNKIGLLTRFFPKRYTHCPFHVSGPLDIDCIQCNICRSAPRKDKREEFYET